MEISDALDAVKAAVDEALNRDGDLLANDAHEQAFTHRLAVYLERQVPGWHVNVEYDLDGTNIKTLPPDPGYPITALEGKDGRIKPDIVVHTRGKRDNQIVIEVKKLKNKDIAKDVWKLRGMTRQDGKYGYTVGIHLIFDDSPALAEISCYIDGKFDEIATALAREPML